MRLAIPAIGSLWLRADALVVEEWFLTETEINEGSCSVNRSYPPGGYPGLQAWTSGNVVTFIPDGNTMFGMLEEEIGGLGAGDAMYGTGWTLAPDLDLLPDGSTHKHGLLYDCVDDGLLKGACDLFGIDIQSCVLEGIMGKDLVALSGADLSHPCCNTSLAGLGSCSSAGGAIARANERGAAVKLMIWANELVDTNGGPYLVYGQERMNHFFQEVPGSESVMILDGRTHDADTTSIRWGGFSGLWPRSLHTKHYSFLDSHGVRSAFVGGIDVAACRNDATDASRRLSITVDCGGWLDQAVKIEGPAAADVANSFVQQYNWKNDGDLVASQSKGDAAKFDAVWAQELGAAAPKLGSGGTQHVQVLRTFACDAGRPFVQGPDGCTGEYTILSAVLKAIRRADKFIFIEDQYGFNVPPIHSELSDALDRGVQVFAVMNAIGQGTNKYCGDNVAEMWGDLRDKGALVYQYNAVDAHKDYVHSKTWIVDDCWFMTGSANLNWRSMTLDAEMSVAVMDDTCDSWVKEVRCRMWSELATNNHSASSICDQPSSTATQVRSVVNLIWGATGDQTTKLKEMELGSGDSWSDWFTSEEKYLQGTCDWLDQDGRCPAVDAVSLALGPRLAAPLAAAIALVLALHLASIAI